MFIKKFGYIIGLLLLAVLVVTPLFMPSCESTTLKRLEPVLVKASEIGLRYAVAKGYLEPGDSLIIRDGVAVVTGDGDPASKLVKLADLGLEGSLAKGLIKEGDVIQLKENDVAVVTSLAEPGSGPSNPLLPVPLPAPAP